MSEHKTTRWKVMADYSCGLWDDEGLGTSPDDEEINASEDFVNRFEAWIDWYHDKIKGPLDVVSFDAEGRALAVELKKMVGNGIQVFFTPEESFLEGYSGPGIEEIEYPLSTSTL